MDEQSLLIESERSRNALLSMLEDEKQLKDSLKKSEEKYRNVVENIKEVIFQTDVNGLWLFLNKSWEEITGFNLDESIGKLFLNFVHPDDRQRNLELFEPLIQRKKAYCRHEIRYLTKDNGFKWIEVFARLAINENNETVGTYGTLVDITDRKLSEEALKQSFSLLEATLESTVDAILVVDDKGKILRFNQKFIELWRIPDSVIQAREDADALSYVLDQLKYPEEFLKKVNELYSKKMAESFDVLEFKDGRVFERFSRPQLINNIAVGRVWSFRDITERKYSEKAIKESEELYRTLINTSPDAVAVTDPQGFITFISNKSLEIFGNSSIQEVVGHNFIEWVAPQDRDKAGRNFKYLVDGESQKEKEYLLLKKNGSTFWGETNAAPVYSTDGRLQSIIIVTRDISLRKMTEESIRKLSLAVQQSPATIVITDIKGNIEYVNPKFTEVTGYSFEEVKGKNSRILKSGTMSSENYKQMWNDLVAGKEWYGEFHNKKKNGEYYWESASISPIFNSNGEITNFLAIKQDITEQKRMTSELIEAKEKAEEMNRVKAYFYANMSHELRTPFVGIMGFSEMLSESLQNPAEKEMAEQILKSSKRLTDTLNKILNVTRLEFDKVNVNLSDVDIVELISQLSVLFSKSASIKNTVIKTGFNPGTIRVKTDGKLLEEILTNLLNNAIKYTENGEIKISAKSILEKDKDYLIVKVSDTGVGIPKEKQEIIWQEFRQASEGMNRSFEGTGLGLTIIKKYVNTLGGSIKLDSEMGEGSAFTIVLPVINLNEKEIIVVQEQVSEQPKISDVLKSRKPKILYVEDDAIALSYVDKVLRSSYEIDTAFNAAIALDLLNKNRYEVIMLDINLGRGIDGVELLQMMRKHEGYAAIPMVAVTAYANESDRLEFLAKGFTHYLSKPFTSVEIRATLSRIFN